MLEIRQADYNLKDFKKIDTKFPVWPEFWSEKQPFSITVLDLPIILF